jgi:small-conductance mechanosensitive channel
VDDPGRPLHGELDADLPDVLALRRRVLLAGLVSLVLFLTVGYVLTALDASSWWLVPAVVLLYVLVVRPLLAPVREVVRLRRRLAYQAFLEQRVEHPEEQP